MHRIAHGRLEDFRRSNSISLGVLPRRASPRMTQARGQPDRGTLPPGHSPRHGPFCETPPPLVRRTLARPREEEFVLIRGLVLRSSLSPLHARRVVQQPSAHQPAMRGKARFVNTCSDGRLVDAPSRSRRSTRSSSRPEEPRGGAGGGEEGGRPRRCSRRRFVGRPLAVAAEGPRMLEIAPWLSSPVSSV